MTKIFFILFIFLCVASLAKGQNKQNDTLFKITYRPAFHSISQLTIYKENNIPKGIFITISGIEGKPKLDTALATISNEIYDSYLNFFSSYNFPGNINNKSDTTKIMEIGLDGINIDGIY